MRDYFVPAPEARQSASLQLWALGVLLFYVFRVSHVTTCFVTHVCSHLGRSEGINTPRATPVNVSLILPLNTTFLRDHVCIAFEDSLYLDNEVAGRL